MPTIEKSKTRSATVVTAEPTAQATKSKSVSGSGLLLVGGLLLGGLGFLATRPTEEVTELTSIDGKVVLRSDGTGEITIKDTTVPGCPSATMPIKLTMNGNDLTIAWDHQGNDLIGEYHTPDDIFEDLEHALFDAGLLDEEEAFATHLDTFDEISRVITEWWSARRTPVDPVAKLAALKFSISDFKIERGYLNAVVKAQGTGPGHEENRIVCRVHDSDAHIVDEVMSSIYSLVDTLEPGLSTWHGTEFDAWMEAKELTAGPAVLEMVKKLVKSAKLEYVSDAVIRGNEIHSSLSGPQNGTSRRHASLILNLQTKTVGFNGKDYAYADNASLDNLLRSFVCTFPDSGSTLVNLWEKEHCKYIVDRWLQSIGQAISMNYITVSLNGTGGVVH